MPLAGYIGISAGAAVVLILLIIVTVFVLHTRLAKRRRVAQAGTPAPPGDQTTNSNTNDGQRLVTDA